MISELRQRFNAAFSPDKYARLRQSLEAGCGTPIAFRVSETPCFLPAALAEQLARYGQELAQQLASDANYLARSEATIPPEFRVPSNAPADARPLFVQADFGLDEAGRPRLVEIQGFPSLYAFQPFLADAYREAYGGFLNDAGLRPLLGNLDRAGYERLLRRAIVGAHDPENVVLLEIRPETQKTLPDFVCTQKMLGVRSVCVTQVVRQGRRLFYSDERGRHVPIARIYNRVIVDELVRTQTRPGWNWRGDVDVEWAGHPDWYFKISKFSLPYLAGHPSVPRTQFLHEVPSVPGDHELAGHVLKPLFSFAGRGVRVGPTRAEIQAIPPDERDQYILQERVHFAPTIETPRGPTKVEIRVMYVWPDDLAAPLPVTMLLRMGRGKIMGVDHNRDQEWVGASAGFVVG